MKNLISPVLIILAGLIVYLYMLPAYRHIGLLKENKTEQEVVLQSIRDMGTRLAEIESEYQSFTDRERGLLTTLVPRTVGESEVVTDMSALATSHGLTVSNVNFIEALPEEGSVQVLNADGSEQTDTGRPYREWTVTVDVYGDYKDFTDFIVDLGRSVRITDVSRVVVQQDEGQEGVGLVKYTVVATIYSLE